MYHTKKHKFRENANFCSRVERSVLLHILDILFIEEIGRLKKIFAQKNEKKMKCAIKGLK